MLTSNAICNMSLWLKERRKWITYNAGIVDELAKRSIKKGRQSHQRGRWDTGYTVRRSKK